LLQKHGQITTAQSFGIDSVKNHLNKRHNSIRKSKGYIVNSPSDPSFLSGNNLRNPEAIVINEHP
jgi:hypothetical protein